MGSDLSRRLVPDSLWDLVEPLIPPFAQRRQGGGSAPLSERAVFTAMVYVLTDGCAWRSLPPSFGVSPATAHRRFTAWSGTGLWERLRRAAPGGPGAARGSAARCEVDWAAAIVDAALARAAGRPGGRDGARDPGSAT